MNSLLNFHLNILLVMNYLFNKFKINVVRNYTSFYRKITELAALDFELISPKEDWVVSISSQSSLIL